MVGVLKKFEHIVECTRCNTITKTIKKNKSVKLTTCKKCNRVCLYRVKQMPKETKHGNMVKCLECKGKGKKHYELYGKKDCYKCAGAGFLNINEREKIKGNSVYEFLNNI